MSKLDSGRTAIATHDDVRNILGGLNPAQMLAIMALRPTVADLEQARLRGVEGPISRENRHPECGIRQSGWDTAKWLIEKIHAHIENDRLMPDSEEAKTLFASLGSELVHVEGDRFRAKPRRDIREDEKPTPTMRRAQSANIKKAQAAVRMRRKAATK